MVTTPQLPLDDCPDENKRARGRPLFDSMLGTLLRRTYPIPPPFPEELYRHIIYFLVDSVIRDRTIRDYRLGYGALEQRVRLISVMLASRLFHSLVCKEWNSHWTESKLPVATRLILVNHVTPFTLSKSPVDLSRHAHLRVVSLDCQRAFECINGTWLPIIPVAKLPPSLQELEFLWSHASEQEMIEVASRLCPNITTLRIVFCTIFKRPGCVWWGAHQLASNHDHYLKGQDPAEVEAYARTMALLLQGFPNLKRLHLGVYFSSYQAVETHRGSWEHVAHHPIQDSDSWLRRWRAQNAIQFGALWTRKYPGYPAPDPHLPCLADQRLWEAPCPACERKWTQSIERAESLAAIILAVELQSLKLVSFGSFVAERRSRPSEWLVCRALGRDPIWVKARRRGVDCSLAESLWFQQSAGQWVQVQAPR